VRPGNLDRARQRLDAIIADEGPFPSSVDQKYVVNTRRDIWTTRALTNTLWAERVPNLPVLMVVTFRPEFEPPWTGQAQVTSLTLSRLGQRDTAILVERLTEGKMLPAEITDRIVVRTDGIPLFIEELTKTLLEGGLLQEEDNRYVLAGSPPPLAIPASLHDSLLARLDRLAPVKEVAQIGATIGREFSYDLLAAVARRPESQLRDALDRLVETGLIFRRGMPPQASFIFKHALVQDDRIGERLWQVALRLV